MTLTYNGYKGDVTYSSDNNTFSIILGSVILVSKSIEDLERQFKHAVNDLLANTF